MSDLEAVTYWRLSRTGEDGLPDRSSDMGMALRACRRWWPPERANATDRVSAVSTLKNLLEGDAVTTSKLDELDAYAARAIEHYDAQRRFSEASGPLFEAACEAIADFTTLRTLIVRNAHV